MIVEQSEVQLAYRRFKRLTVSDSKGNKYWRYLGSKRDRARVVDGMCMLHTSWLPLKSVLLNFVNCFLA